MTSQEVTQSMLAKSMEGITGIQIDQSVVVIALIGILIIYIGFRIVVDAIASAVEDRNYNYDDDAKEADWYHQGASNNDNAFDRDVNKAKYNRLVRKYGSR